MVSLRAKRWLNSLVWQLNQFYSSCTVYIYLSAESLYLVTMNQDVGSKDEKDVANSYNFSLNKWH